MSTFRRGLAVVLGLALVVLTVAFAMRWVDVATREEALLWAAKTAKACRCAQEVRELMPDPMVDDYRRP